MLRLVAGVRLFKIEHFPLDPHGVSDTTHVSRQWVRNVQKTPQTGCPSAVVEKFGVNGASRLAPLDCHHQGHNNVGNPLGVQNDAPWCSS
jgi:hypothetical protein